MVGIGAGTGRWAVPGILLVGVVALAGVALWPSPGSPEPAGTVTVPARTGKGTASDTASVPVPVPVLPPAAKAHDAAGAQAFARYWFDVVNYTFATRDTALFRSLALPECGFCKDFASRVDRRRAENSTYEGGRFAIGTVVAPAPDTDGRVTVEVRADVSAATVRAASGEVIDSSPAVKGYAVALQLTSDPRGWTVSGVAKQ